MEKESKDRLLMRAAYIAALHHQSPEEDNFGEGQKKMMEELQNYQWPLSKDVITKNDKGEALLMEDRSIPDMIETWFEGKTFSSSLFNKIERGENDRLYEEISKRTRKTEKDIKEWVHNEIEERIQSQRKKYLSGK
jgi:hypothetical protein